MPDDATPRRSFLAWCAAGATAALGALFAAPILAAVLEPLRRKSQKQGFLPIGKLDGFPVGQPVRAEIKGEVRDAWTRTSGVKLGAVWVTRREDGTVQCLSTVCPHLGCAVDKSAAGFACPCHGSAFDERGNPIAGPSPRPMDAMEARADGGTVLVRYTRYRQGMKDKVPV